MKWVCSVCGYVYEGDGSRILPHVQGSRRQV